MQSSGSQPHCALLHHISGTDATAKMCHDLNAVLGLAMPTKEENISLHHFLCLFMMHIFMMDMKSQISMSSSGRKSTYSISATYVEKQSCESFGDFTFSVSTTHVLPLSLLSLLLV